jgi:hypothetical protein
LTSLFWYRPPAAYRGKKLLRKKKKNLVKKEKKNKKKKMTRLEEGDDPIRANPSSSTIMVDRKNRIPVCFVVYVALHTAQCIQPVRPAGPHALIIIEPKQFEYQKLVQVKNHKCVASVSVFPAER